MSDLSFRAKQILYAVVTEYIATGAPVGSRRLARRYGLNLSPASIRNVLADLKDAGYLTQPHASAGRVPTDSGFRLFVDALVQMREVTAEDRDTIVARMRDLTPETDDVMRETGKLLSVLAGTASLVAPPKTDDEALSQLRFVSLDQNRVLAVLVLRSGAVQNRIVHVSNVISGEELDRLHNYLVGITAGQTLGQLRDALAQAIADERGQYRKLSEHAHQMVTAAVSAQDEAPQVVIEGQGLLFGKPEFTDPDKIRAFLHAFEDRELLLELLDHTLGSGGVQVLIGSETNLIEVGDVSLISATYRHGAGGSGTLGVIGPARMDYGKVVPLVEFTANVMSRVLATDDPEHD